MKISLKYMIVLILPALLFSCTERVDIELDSTYTRLVVEGGITDQPGPHTIHLSLSGDYFGNEPAPKVEGATVTISTDDTTYFLLESAPGVYQTSEDVKGIAGKTYTLNIDGVEIDGESLQYSAESKMPEVPPVDSVAISFNPDWEIWEVNLYAWDPPSREHYLFRIYRNGELLTDTIREYVVTNDDFFNGNYTFGIMVQWMEESEAGVGDTITLEMASITEEYANFIWDVQDESGYNNPLFSGPPANIRGNISNGAIGFFAAYSLLRDTAIIRDKEPRD